MIVSEQPDAGVLLAFPVDHWQFHDDIIGLRSGDTRPSLDLNASTMPDGAIALATYAANADGPSRLTGLRTLRVKETDRIAALANELRKVGCSVETGDDWISITPPPEKHAGSDRREDPDRRGHAADRSGSSSLRSSDPASPVIIETYNDHRMAMAFAVLGLVRPGISIRNPKCVAKSYPGFWKDFAKLYQ
jgi:3-phosphoshikimate 1-carboxyvinyltransferase